MKSVLVGSVKIDSVSEAARKKTVTKHQKKKLCQMIVVLVEELELLYGLCFIFNGKKFWLRTLKKI